MKTVHGPDAHVTKKQRNDVHLRAPLLKENGDHEASAEPGGRGSEESAEASSTSQAVEDCLHIKAIKTESSGVSRAGQWRPQSMPPTHPQEVRPSSTRAQSPSCRVGSASGSPALSASSSLQLNFSSLHYLGPLVEPVLCHVLCCWAGPRAAGMPAPKWSFCGRFLGSALPTGTICATVGPLPSVLSLCPCPRGLHSFCSNHLFFVSTSFSRLYLP